MLRRGQRIAFQALILDSRTQQWDPCLTGQAVMVHSIRVNDPDPRAFVPPAGAAPTCSPGEPGRSRPCPGSLTSQAIAGPRGLPGSLPARDPRPGSRKPGTQHLQGKPDGRVERYPTPGRQGTGHARGKAAWIHNEPWCIITRSSY